MIGRMEEQAYLKMAINDPEQIGVLLAGVAGVGKTRLLREVTAAALQCHVELLTATDSARQRPVHRSPQSFLSQCERSRATSTPPSQN